MNNIIEIKKRKEKHPIQIIDNRNRLCDHPSLKVNRKSRIVTCSDCNQVFDGFEAFMIYARRYENYRVKLLLLKNDISQKEEELNKLKRDIANAKQTKKRACANFKKVNNEK